MMRTFWVLGLCFGVFLYGCKEGAQETANVLTVKEFLALQEGPFDGYVIFPKATYDSLFSKAKEYPLDSIKAKTSKIRFFDLSVSEIPRNAIIPKGPSIKDVIIATLNCPNGKVPTRTGEYRWECLDPEEPYIFLEGECTSFLRIERTLEGQSYVFGCSSISNCPYCGYFKAWISGGIHDIYCGCDWRD